ncbi:polysaccharide deacetylase family protein [Thalassospira mesophila]|uniref:Uncharacterized protein n=1 Tax=Thalassospira mesophila TaxID=1293891 RepID=A0A1Y2KV20_9PROT|nr:hypothetical protein [Thalassospira mesophila]OSQ35560.1 hypothetical protein TMES_20770 [Thalassospira mesophila]
MGITLIASLMLACGAQARPVSREIASVYYSPEDPKPRFTPGHSLAETVLNYLGLTVTHFDLGKGLPKFTDPHEFRGILVWMEIDRLPDPEGFLTWLETQMDAGTKVVILGDWSFLQNLDGKAVSLARVNRVLSRLGGIYTGDWQEFTFDFQPSHSDPDMTGYEAGIARPLPPFYSVTASASGSVPFVTAHTVQGSAPYVLGAFGPSGGFVMDGYAVRFGRNEHDRKWILNPFKFFSRAFDLEEFPKVDTTTLMGRRIYYSHIDGDGWRNVSEVRGEGEQTLLDPEVVYRDLILPYPDLPVSVAPIAADIDPTWAGTRRTGEIARKLFALPQVEVASHTYTHPFQWSYFDNYSAKRESRDFGQSSRDVSERFMEFLGIADDINASDTGLKKTYELPRAYVRRPFDLRQEIIGAANYISTFAPPGKKVELLQWSGDTSPFEAAIALADSIDLPNLNGGDSRWDPDYPSLAWVAPVGMRVGKRVQIYASNSNENTYTRLWSDRYFGFKYLARTIENTESPIRLRPFNIYYHMYSGEKIASRNAVIDNLNLARKSPIIPVAASRYARLAKGFFTAEIEQTKDGLWRIRNRGQADTIRFDNGARLAVDFDHSVGVIGQTHYQGSLYISLDESVDEPVISVLPGTTELRYPVASHPYVISSRWRAWDVTVGDNDSLHMKIQGYGAGDMQWRTRPGARFRAIVPKTPTRPAWSQTVTADENGMLGFTIPVNGISGGELSLEPVTE